MAEKGVTLLKAQYLCRHSGMDQIIAVFAYAMGVLQGGRIHVAACRDTVDQRLGRWVSPAPHAKRCFPELPQRCLELCVQPDDVSLSQVADADRKITEFDLPGFQD